MTESQENDFFELINKIWEKSDIPVATRLRIIGVMCADMHNQIKN
jgi:hypothetical protein